jgi:hypothetical protein
MLCRTIGFLAIAFALGGYTLPTAAFAASGTFEGGRVIAGGAKTAHRGGRSLNRYDYEPNRYDSQRHAWGRPAYEWDPWGHWGAYYGPSPAPL